MDSFDDVTWHGAASYFEGASQRMGEKFIEQVLHVNNIITKIQTKLKAENYKDKHFSIKKLGV